VTWDRRLKQPEKHNEIFSPFGWGKRVNLCGIRSRTVWGRQIFATSKFSFWLYLIFGFCDIGVNRQMSKKKPRFLLRRFPNPLDWSFCDI